jgi:CBS domain-containing protein
MNVSDLMAKPVRTIDQHASLAEAAYAMLDCDAGFLPVVDEGHLVGVVTDRDLVLRGMAQNRSPVNTQVHELMSVKVVCCFADQSMDEARALVSGHNVRRLPVIDHEHRLLGILSRQALGFGELPASENKPLKVTFQKTKTDSYGHPHKIPVKTVYVTVTSKEEAIEKAREHYEQEQGTAWTNVADEVDVDEMGGQGDESKSGKS